MLRREAIDIWKAGVAAVHGRTLVERALTIRGNLLYVNDRQIDLNEYDRILAVGGGKFSHFMAEGLENVLGDRLSQEKHLSGLVTVPDGSNGQVRLQFIESAECRPAGVNLPTRRVIDATGRILEMLHQSNDRTLVVALISGGGSALLEKTELPIEDVVAATNWLSSHGANILQLNTVRIALSDVKGGGLARAMRCGEMISLIVSDVPGDDLRFVSSGPTVAFGKDLIVNAKSVLEQFNVMADPAFPDAVMDFLATREQNTSDAKVKNVLIGDASVALLAAKEKATELGYEITVDGLANTITCSDVANAAAKFLDASEGRKQCLLSLGEPVVSPGEGAGQGGRNQHAGLLTLQKLIAKVPENEFCFLSGGTDGEDGNTAVAGAVFTDLDVKRLANCTSEIADCLDRFDSHRFLFKNEMVLGSGPTGTNVADLRVLLRN